MQGVERGDCILDGFVLGGSRDSLRRRIDAEWDVFEEFEGVVGRHDEVWRGELRAASEIEL
jgi:hypothetical protein